LLFGVDHRECNGQSLEEGAWKITSRELDDARVGGRASNPSEYRGGFLRRPRIKKLRVVERTEELDVELYRRLFRDINRLLVARYRNFFP
jgi:hypothetical protein